MFIRPQPYTCLGIECPLCSDGRLAAPEERPQITQNTPKTKGCTPHTTVTALLWVPTTESSRPMSRPSSVGKTCKCPAQPPRKGTVFKRSKRAAPRWSCKALRWALLTERGLQTLHARCGGLTLHASVASTTWLISTADDVHHACVSHLWFGCHVEAMLGRPRGRCGKEEKVVPSIGTEVDQLRAAVPTAR